MAMKTFCDRCGGETTGIQSGHLTGIDDADEQGGGNITHEVDLCAGCYAALVDWLEPSRFESGRLKRADDPNT